MRRVERRRASHLDDAAAALADAQRIDWTQLADNDGDALEGLRLLEDVASAFRDAGAHVPTTTTQTRLFDWGPLQVRALLGRGAVGEVWRAYDPALQREVALKLRPVESSGASNAEFLAEARHLAQLRHRHVLAIYGAGQHCPRHAEDGGDSPHTRSLDARAGLWTELIEGRNLASVVAQEGSLAPAEALRIAHELAGALAAIHAAGLIHGDVKAENVIREAGGRSVLMDFGSAGGDAEVAARSVLQATPRYLPPEVREGRSLPTSAIDLYALGVLLHFLLTGRYPDPQSPLAMLRPDLDRRVVQLVSGMLDEDPAQRPRDARQLFAQLGSIMQPAQATSRATRTVSGVALALALAAVAGLFWQSRTALPTWEPEASFLDPSNNAPRSDGAPLALGDELALRYRATQASYVYVLNADDNGAVHVLFPVSELDLVNPLSAGEHLLPGKTHGRSVAWSVDSPAQNEEFVVLASPVRLAQLEARLQAPDIAPARVERGTASLVARVPLPTTLHGAALRDLVALAQRELEDPGQLRVWVLQAPHRH